MRRVLSCFLTTLFVLVLALFPFWEKPALAGTAFLPRDRFCNKADSLQQHRHLQPPTDYSDKGCPLYYEKLLPTVAYNNGGQQVLAPDWSRITWSELPPIQESGSTQMPQNFFTQIGYSLSRVWQAGQMPDKLTTLGDVADGFHLEAFTLNDISDLTGLATQNLSLNDFGLAYWQTPDSLIKAIPELGNLNLSEVQPLQDLAAKSGLSYASATIADIVQQNPSFANTPLSQLDLKQYSIGSIPGLSQTFLAKFKGWQQSFISDIPGLNQVAFSQFPVPLIITGLSLAITDVVWGKSEHGDPEVDDSYFVSGSINRQGQTVPVACPAGQSCPYIELSDPTGVSGPFHGKRWANQLVKGGFGPLAILNGGKEPAGRAVFGADFGKIVLNYVNESNGSADFSLYKRICAHFPFIGKSCSPYFIPLPWPFSTREGDLLIVSAFSPPNISIPQKYRDRLAQIEGQNQPQPPPPTSTNQPSQNGNGTIPGDGQATGNLHSPVPDGTSITSDFGPRSAPTAGASDFHKGVDLGVGNGTPVKAADGGTVVYAGPAKGYGNVLIIDHGNGVQTRYAHLESSNVEVGQKVAQGQPVALSDSTGIGTGAHLHFEVRINSNPAEPFSGEAIDPKGRVHFF